MARTYQQTPREALRIARRLGKAKGEGSFDPQYLPGGGRDTAPNASERAARVLKGLDDGDPKFDSLSPPDWLSGEWADEPLVQDIAYRCGIDSDRDEDGEAAQDCANAYCAAADSAWVDALYRHLRAVAKDGAS